MSGALLPGIVERRSAEPAAEEAPGGWIPSLGPLAPKTSTVPREQNTNFPKAFPCDKTMLHVLRDGTKTHNTVCS